MDGLQISFQSLSVAPDSLLLLLAAMVLDLVTPGRGRQWGNLDPTQWLIAATRFLESRLNRADRSVAKRSSHGECRVLVADEIPPAIQLDSGRAVRGGSRGTEDGKCRQRCQEHERCQEQERSDGC